MTKGHLAYTWRGLRLAINGRPASRMLGPRGVFTAAALPPNPERAAQIARYLVHCADDVHTAEAK
jgi:hypothetical protein